MSSTVLIGGPACNRQEVTGLVEQRMRDGELDRHVFVELAARPPRRG
jgi:hypothetical protein